MACALLGLYLFISEPVWLFHAEELRLGNEIVAQVEAFRRGQGRLPEDLSELGYRNADELSVFYTKTGDHHYVVSFGTWSLGVSEAYDSSTGRWERGG